MESDLISKGEKQLRLASRQLFSNTFPHLRHPTLHMSGFDTLSLSQFLERHPDLRSFACVNRDPALLSFTDDVLPHLTCLAGDTRILSVLCDAWKEPHPKVVKLKAEYVWKTELFTAKLLPKLPRIG